jgi:hypothetical protein
VFVMSNALGREREQFPAVNPGRILRLIPTCTIVARESSEPRS